MPITHIIAAAAAAATKASATTSKASSVNSDFEWETLESQELNIVEEVKYPVLIDTDGGTEDAWALLMALKAHQDPQVPFDIVGITCVHGATTVDNATKNVRRLLRTVGIKNIPIFRGSETALVRSFQSDEDPPYNGHDGFGDANLPEIDPCVEKVNGVTGIIQNAIKYKGKLRVLALGPLTNLALSVRMMDEMKDDLRSLFVLGGNMEGVGNATPSAEFNFAADAEAAHVVLSTFSCPLFILPWETSLRSGTSAHSWRLHSLGKIPTKEVDLMNQIEAKLLKRYTEGWVATDALCTAIFIEPRVVVKKRKFHCRVELQGSETRGMLVVDHSFRHQKPPNVILLQEVNLSLYEKMLLWAAGGDFYKQ